MRSAPIVGRGLTTVGLGAVAYSAQMPTTQTVQFSLLTKRQAKETMIKTERGWMTQYEDAIFREKRSGVKRIWMPGHPVAQTKRMARNPVIGRPTRITSPSKIARMRAMRAAGASSVVLGKALPVLAVGYVGHSLLTDGPSSADKEIQRALFGGTLEENKQKVEEMSEQTVLGSPYALIALRTGFTVGFGAVTGLFS